MKLCHHYNHNQSSNRERSKMLLLTPTLFASSSPFSTTQAGASSCIVASPVLDIGLKFVTKFVTAGDNLVLSVSEFVTAGDNLVSKCPTWVVIYVRESGEPSKRKPYVPSEKEYLITRNVPCLRRAACVEEEYEAAGAEVLIDNEDNDGWLATHGKPKDKSSEEENFSSIESLEISKVKSAPSQVGGEDEDDIPDMADYEEVDNIEIDPGLGLQVVKYLAAKYEELGCEVKWMDKPDKVI